MKHIENKIIAISAAALLLATACNRIDDIAGGLQNMGFDAKVVSTQVADGWELIGADDGTGPAESFLTDEAGTMSFPVTCEVMDAVDAPVTKGSLINYNDDSSHGKQALSGYLTEFKAFAYNIVDEFFTKATGNCETVTYSSGKWSASHTYKWPEDTELQFLAYANAPADSISIYCDEINSYMAEILEYSIPEKASDQNDILLGTYIGEGDRTIADIATASIEFLHPLTSVRIKIASSESAKLGAIQKISLIGVMEKYSYTLKYDGTGNGSAFTGSGYNRIVYQEKDGGLDIDEDGYIGVPFIIAPQDINEHPVSLKVETVSGITLYATLSNDGNKLDAGKVNVFNIGYDNNVYVFNLVGDSDVLTYKNTTESETQTITLVSYRHPLGDSSDTQPVAFKAEYSTNGGATWQTSNNTGLTGFTSNNTGCITATGYNLKASYRSYYIPDPDSHFIWENDSYGSMLDLSTVDANGDAMPGGASSANCYVIHHPGEYKIPLVYGNALQNGTINPDAYSTSNSGDRILSTFLNCFGTPITNGWILTDLSGRYSNAKACLLWQDAWEGKSGSNPGVGFITEVGIDGNYITFKTATGANLIESNAMIALYDEKGSNNQYDEGVDQILWSWHIWASEANFSAAGCQKTSKGVEFSPVNLGFCKGRKVIYKVDNDSYKHVLIKLTQLQGHAAPILITVNRPDVTSTREADCTIYQTWRKDPMRAYGNKEIKKWYTINGTSIPSGDGYQLPSGVTGAQAIALEISHPDQFISEPGSYKARGYNNLWSMKNTSNDSREESDNFKTIYDPSPVGFKVPYRKAFETFDNKYLYTESRPDRVIYILDGVEFFYAAYRFNGRYSSTTIYLNSGIVVDSKTGEEFLPGFNADNGFSSNSKLYTNKSAYPLLPIREIYR